MDLLLYIVLSAALVALIITLLKWAEAEDNEARGHERIRSKRERGRLASTFEDIVSDLRKKPRD
jgi:hypothetical protein